MSRNLCSTECECGFWRFQGDREVLIGSRSLMTEDDYFAAIGWNNCPYKGNQGHGTGYGYRTDLAGDSHWWRSPDGNGGSTGYRLGYVRELAGVYHSIPPEDRYRWVCLECPVCLRLYAGWYVRQPHYVPTKYEADPPVYGLYDLSYFHAFNDEPSDKDIARLVTWSPEDIVSALVAWRARE